MTNIKHEIPRTEGWEPIFEPLVRKITGIKQGEVKAGCDYKSELFILRTPFLGTCSCSYEQKKKEFDAENYHQPDCFHPQWLDIHETFKNHPNYNKHNIYKVERINMESQLCKKFNLPYNAKTIADVCTCGINDKWNALNYEHDAGCPVILPNIEYFGQETIKIWWYKTFFRDAYSNVPLTKEQFKGIIATCLKYVNQNPSTLVYMK